MAVYATNGFYDCGDDEAPFDGNSHPEKEEPTRNTSDNVQEVPFFMKSYATTGNKQTRDNSILQTPKTIYEHLNDNVYGHDEYKRVISTFVWKVAHHHHPDGAVLVAGASGCGKTEVLRALKKIYPNIAIIDGASIVPQGYKGSNTLFGGFQLLDFDDKDNPPIMAIDEFDKLLGRAYDPEGLCGLLGELLKMLEGEIINISGDERRPKFVDTSQCSFVLLGCFSTLADTVLPRSIGFGEETVTCSGKAQLRAEAIRSFMPSELNGRITSILVLKNLEKDDYLHILQDERYSPIFRLSKEYDVDMQISPQKCIEISEAAYDNNTGVRSMNSDISKILDDELFEDPYTKVIVIG